MKKEIIRLKESLMDELGEMSMKPLTGANLDVIHKLATSAEKICKMEEMEDDGYSERRGMYSRDGGNMMGRGMSRMNNAYSSTYDGDSSYARRGRHYVRGHYSYDEGKSAMIEELEDLMEDATNDRERSAIGRRLKELKH